MGGPKGNLRVVLIGPKAKGSGQIGTPRSSGDGSPDVAGEKEKDLAKASLEKVTRKSLRNLREMADKDLAAKDYKAAKDPKSPKTKAPVKPTAPPVTAKGTYAAAAATGSEAPSHPQGISQAAAASSTPAVEY